MSAPHLSERLRKGVDSMFRLGLKEFQRSIYVNIFVIIQLAVTLILTVAIVSSVASRSRYYKPFEDVLSGDGVVVRMSGAYSDDNTGGIDLLNTDFVTNICTAYIMDGMYDTIGIFYENGKEAEKEISCWPQALNDEYVERLSPEMEDGKWLSETDYRDKSKIYGVITDNRFIHVGDTVAVIYYYYDESDINYENPLQREVEVEIVGVIRNGEKIPDVRREYSRVADFDFRNLYYDYLVERDVEPVLFVPYSQIEGTDATASRLNGFSIINIEENISEQEKQEVMTVIERYSTIVGENKDINARSVNYINSQMTKLLPLLICAFILVVVSCVSICALSVSRNLRIYGIYYVCGSKWNNCLFINLVNNLITSLLAVLLAVISINVIKLAGLLKNTVFDFGLWQFVFCTGLIALNIIISMIIPVILMRRNTPKEILTNNE